MRDLFNELLVRELGRLTAAGVSHADAEFELDRVRYGLTSTASDRNGSDYVGFRQPLLLQFFREYFSLPDVELLQITPEVHAWMLQLFAVREWLAVTPSEFNTLGMGNTFRALGNIYRLYSGSVVSYTVMGVFLEFDEEGKVDDDWAVTSVWRLPVNDSVVPFAPPQPSIRGISEDILAYIDMFPRSVEGALTTLLRNAGEFTFSGGEIGEVRNDLRRWGERFGGEESTLIERVLRSSAQ